MLDAGYSILVTGVWKIHGVGYRIEGGRLKAYGKDSCWRLDAGCSILDARCWMLDTGYSMLDARCWILDTGSWPLVAGVWKIHGVG